MPTSIEILSRAYRRAYWRLTVGISIFYVVALIGGVSLLVSNGKIATWVSDAAHAEFALATQPSASETIRLTQPDQPVRHAKAD